MRYDPLSRICHFFMRCFPCYFEKRVSATKVIRFIFSKSHYSSTQKTAKYAAFLPPPKSLSALSVYQYSLDIGKMFSIGDDFVGVCHPSPKTVKACAVVAVDEIVKIDCNPKLNVLSWPKPHYLHANIKPFPTDHSQEKHIAHLLSKMASLELRTELK